jgi:hypothetical protein
MSNDIESLIQSRKATSAPRVEFATIQKMVDALEYQYIVTDHCTTICIATYYGFKCGMGEASCVDPNNFDETIGRTVSHKRAEANATDTLWMLEGWRLHCSLQWDTVWHGRKVINDMPIEYPPGNDVFIDTEFQH